MIIPIKHTEIEYLLRWGVFLDKFIAWKWLGIDSLSKPTKVKYLKINKAMEDLPGEKINFNAETLEELKNQMLFHWIKSIWKQKVDNWKSRLKECTENNDKLWFSRPVHNDTVYFEWTGRGWKGMKWDKKNNKPLTGANGKVKYIHLYSNISNENLLKFVYEKEWKRVAWTKKGEKAYLRTSTPPKISRKFIAVQLRKISKYNKSQEAVARKIFKNLKNFNNELVNLKSNGDKKNRSKVKDDKRSRLINKTTHWIPMDEKKNAETLWTWTVLTDEMEINEVTPSTTEVSPHITIKRDLAAQPTPKSKTTPQYTEGERRWIAFYRAKKWDWPWETVDELRERAIEKYDYDIDAIMSDFHKTCPHLI